MPWNGRTAASPQASTPSPVQWLTYYSEDNNVAGTFAIDDWHLTVEQIAH